MATSPVTAPSDSDSPANAPPPLSPPSDGSPPASNDSSLLPPSPSGGTPPPSNATSPPPAPSKQSAPPMSPPPAPTPPPAGSQAPPAPQRSGSSPAINAPPPNNSSSSSSPSPPSGVSSSPPPSNNSPPVPPSDDSSSSPPSNNSSSPPSAGSSSSPPSGGSSSSPPSSGSSSSPSSGGSSSSPPSGGSSSSPPSGGSSSSPPSGGSSSSPSRPSTSNTTPSFPSNTPTPHAPKALAPPSHKGSPSHSKGDSPAPTNHSDSGVNIPLVVGVTAGIGLFLVLMIVVFVCCTKKKKRPHDGMHYCAEPPHGGPRVPKGNDYISSGPNWPMDHIVKLPPPPGAMAPPGGGWRPPPPLVTLSCSDMSSSYSGTHGTPLPPPSPSLALGFSKSTFSYEELAAATNGFSQANLLGQGGFGYVHKGVLSNGKEVAVKQLKAGSGQGEREFQAEVEIISRVHHRHLVSLEGYCIAGEQRLLVYEFVPNKTLEFHLHGKDRPVMDFPTRLKIALGSAKGLAYLHEDCHPRIIHRDIKAANILLDYKFEAMVADFGLAKLSSDNYTHVSTRVMGTFGYLAPEYASSGKLTDKSDVFSFGVMLLELITGCRPVDHTHTIMEDSLVDWARPILTQALNDANFEELVDPRLEGNYNHTEMARLAACAAASVRHSARRRPKMSQIVRTLEGDLSLEDLNEGIKPGHSSAFGSPESSERDTSSSYTSEMRRFRKVALASQEFGSSEYGATSDYGLNPSASSSDYGNSRELNTAGNQRHGV